MLSDATPSEALGCCVIRAQVQGCSGMGGWETPMMEEVEGTPG